MCKHPFPRHPANTQPPEALLRQQSSEAGTSSDTGAGTPLLTEHEPARARPSPLLTESEGQNPPARRQPVAGTKHAAFLQQRFCARAIRQSPLTSATRLLLLQVLNHCVDHPTPSAALRPSACEIVTAFGLADWAYRLKTERVVLQEVIQQAEDIGLVCLEPISYLKSEYVLRWTPEHVARQPRLTHPRATARPLHHDEPACELPVQIEVEMPPQHWKGRPPRRVWRQLREAVLARDDRTCHYCGTRRGRMTCDHKIPVSRGGTSTLENLVTACIACNSAKATKTADEWAQTNSRQSRKEVR